MLQGREEIYRQLRQSIAHKIAGHLGKVGYEYHQAERWRFGYLPLNIGQDTQVKQAIARGDTVFVQENFARAVTVHEGPGTQRTGAETEAHEHNDNRPEVNHTRF